MRYPFRIHVPVRTYKGHHADYHAYKDNLAVDFNHRCGYTDCQDHWLGGQRTFQIDHLKPWTKYPDRKTDYKNLIYCCSYVNRAKWDDDSPNYLDPCDNDFNEHFYRDDEGIIRGESVQGQYMVKHMCLSLRHYAIVWNLERLENRIEKLKVLSERNPELKPILADLLLTYYDYIRSLRIHQ